jgi:hypothetical protein
VTSWLTPVSCVSISGAGAAAADIPVASENDNPAAPKAGVNLRFEGCFWCDMYSLRKLYDFSL